MHMNMRNVTQENNYACGTNFFFFFFINNSLYPTCVLITLTFQERASSFSQSAIGLTFFNGV
jgi:hypothetical protein